MTNAQIFRVLDQIAAGLEREAQLSEAEREAKREEILAWFRPLHARLQAAYFERPCPIPWTLALQDGVDVPPLPEPHERGLLQCGLRLVEAGARALDDPVATEEGCRRMKSSGAAARSTLGVLLVLVLAILAA